MQSFFDYAAAQGPDKDKDRGGKDDDQKKDDKGKEGPVRTQMIGESPGDDLGYDPSIIPTEPIPDDDED